jgi:hypothetical protein
MRSLVAVVGGLGAASACPRLVAAASRTQHTAGVWAVTLVWTLLLGLHAPVYDTILVALVFILLAAAGRRRPDAGQDPALQWLLLWTVVAAWISQFVARVAGLQVFTLVLLLIALYADRLLEKRRAAEQSLA